MAITDADAAIPSGLATDEFVLRPIRATDAEADYAAIMDTRESLRLWQMSTWPEDDFTVEKNRDDLIGLEQRHDERRAYTYTVVDPSGATCVGCVYVFPTTAAFLTRATVTAVGDDAWEDVDAVVFFWARRPQLEAGLDARLLSALRAWFAGAWGLAHTVFSTSEPFTQQVDLLERSGLALKFELRDPSKPGKQLAFG